MLIPGFLITWVTFPGVIIHEMGHKFFCHLTNTVVLDVCYFRFGNPAGYVIHERPTSIWKHFLIGFGPLIFNSLSGFLLGALAARFFWRQGATTGIDALMCWLAISIAMHSFPSTSDAKSIWQALWEEGTPILARLVGTPLVGLIYLGAIGSVVWLDLIYGFLIGYYLPKSVMG
jgi:hypothetical protein